MRYVLTDILMTVTNEEMQRLSEEVLTEIRAKGTFVLKPSFKLGHHLYFPRLLCWLELLTKPFYLV